MKDVSDKEIALFKSLGYENLLFILDKDPVGLYKMAAEKCFIEDRRGAAVDSLRRCMEALSKHNPYRLTPEFEELIQLGEPYKG